MKIKKNLINESLKRATKVFNDKILKIDNDIIIEYIDDEIFLHEAKKEQLTSLFMNIKLYENLNKEYATFCTVYDINKIPLLKSIGRPYVITVSIDRAKKFLKNEQPKAVEAYLDYLMLSQLVAIYEQSLIEKYNIAFNLVMKESPSEEIATEEFCSLFPLKYSDGENAINIDNKLNRILYQKMKKHTNEDLSLKPNLEKNTLDEILKHI